MKLHANARTCPNSRRLLVDRIEREGWALTAAAEAAAVRERTACKWLARWRSEGERGLVDRSSAPRSRPGRIAAERLAAIEALRRLRMTGAEIAECLGMALSTVSRWLRRIGLGRLSRLEPPEPPNRYERKRAGELVHLDVKKLGRIVVPGHRVTGNRRIRADRTRIGSPDGRKLGTAGWEFVHVCVDDATRLAYAEVLPDERGPTAAAFLRRACEWFLSLGISVERVMSDNGSCYRSHLHASTCAALGLKPIFTQPYRPRTNGKAERFIQTLTRRWAHGALYATSTERAAALPGWLAHYNFTRRHGSLGHRPPAARLAELEQRHE
jgi:transposase InsO family protein